MKSVWRIRRAGPRRILPILIRAIQVSVVVGVAAFALVRLTPGDPVLLLLGDQATPEAVMQMRAELGLDGTLLEQLWGYFRGLLVGDLGTSIAYESPVAALILERMPVTLGLMGLTAVFSSVLAIPLAAYGAVRAGRVFNLWFEVASSLLIAMPPFFLGLLAILFLGVRLGIAPVAGIGEGFSGAIAHLWLPSLVISGALVPLLARVLRSTMEATMQEEFYEVAVVRGVNQSRLLRRYLMRPSLAPTVALLSYIVGSMFAAAVVVELVFDIPGVGTLLVAAVGSRDYPVVQGITLISGLVVVFTSTLGELIAGWVDPRAAT